MRLMTPKFSARQAALVALALLLIIALLRPGKISAQRNAPAAVAQVGPGSPLPVFVTNEMQGLPEGFEPGTKWRFTTWTVPSTLTFMATVDQTEGGWAQLTLSTDPPNTGKWYFIPMMPGAWEQQ